MDFITDFYYIKVSYKVHVKIGNESQLSIHETSISISVDKHLWYVGLSRVFELINLDYSGGLFGNQIIKDRNTGSQPKYKILPSQEDFLAKALKKDIHFGGIIK